MPHHFDLCYFRFSFLNCSVTQIDLRRANNCGIMLTKVKMPLPELMVSCWPIKLWNVPKKRKLLSEHIAAACQRTVPHIYLL
jgi:hypothetical protein